MIFRKLVLITALLGLQFTTASAKLTEKLWVYDGEQLWLAEVARSSEDQARGLMYRPYLLPMTAMLFVFSPPRQVSFWMKNTPLNLTIRFYNQDGILIDSHFATPCWRQKCPLYNSSSAVYLALETRKYDAITNISTKPLTIIAP